MVSLTIGIAPQNLMKKASNILITGCASGMGLHAAQTLQARGYRVFATVRQTADVNKLHHLGLESLRLDLNDSDSIHAAVTEILKRTGGKLEALFNNAGYGQPGAIEDLSRDLIRQQFETNVFGLMELTNAVIPIMRKQGHGRIINNSSLLGLVTMPYRGAYNASKFALEGLSDTLRQELYGSGIRVSLIEPGPIASNFRANAYAAYIKAIAIDQSVHGKAYEKMAAYYGQNQGQGLLTQTPAAVTRKLIHALESKRPKARYYVGFPTYCLALAKQLLPTKLLDALVRKL